MKTASVSKLKASLSEYLKRVKAGEEVLVTERVVSGRWWKSEEGVIIRGS
jgi:hypothetical protein